MRKPKYLSPTSVSKFYDDRSEFYLTYLADNRPPRLPQTKPMSIGSSFDAYVKAYLYERIIGKVNSAFEFDTIFINQVESHNRDWALVHGEYVFACYKKSGALSNLVIELADAMEEPRFEFTVEARVTHESTIEGIPLLGKPDVFFVSKNGERVIIDWKVNGYCGSGNTSPKKEYIWVSDGWGLDIAPPSRNNRMCHRSAQVMSINGVNINISSYFEEIDVSWSAQLSIYSWLLGEPVGGKFLIGIDQIACNGAKTFDMIQDNDSSYILAQDVHRSISHNYPLVRIASHRARISEQFQQDLFSKIRECWGLIESGYIFNNLSREESDARCTILDDYYLALTDSEDPKEQWFTNMARQQRGG